MQGLGRVLSEQRIHTDLDVLLTLPVAEDFKLSGGGRAL